MPGGVAGTAREGLPMPIGRGREGASSAWGAHLPEVIAERAGDHPAYLAVQDRLGDPQGDGP
jgi:hypothetical protein